MKKLIIKALPTRLYLEYRYRHFRKTKASLSAKYDEMRKVIGPEGYSFKPFDEKKCIFIHIPKCAGVSVNNSLFGCLAGGHTTLDEYIEIFEPNCLQSYFKFTIVRNPWDRLVSAYFFLQKGGFGSRDRIWFEEELSSFRSFDGFVTSWVNEKNIWKWHHFRPQYHYFQNKHDKVKVDFVGYLENLNHDFDVIAQRLGVHSALESANLGKHDSYMDYYTEDTKRIVEAVYHKDIELLGYDFHSAGVKGT